MINWHRLFGLTLSDYFTGTRYRVDMEVDVARKRQLLDVLIIRGEGPLPPEPCDGLERLCRYNLLTYKSGHESLTPWSIEELIGHYVNYRKAFAMGSSPQDFGLYAVSTRRPRDLLRRTNATKRRPGVYALEILSREITLILPREVEPGPRNALWELFSFEAARVVQGAQDYRWRQPDHVSVLNEIYHHYQALGIAMPYTFEDFRRDVAREVLPELSAEERLRGLPPEERLRGLQPEDRLRGLPPEERLRGLQPEDRLRGLPPEERLRGLQPEDRLSGLDEEDLARLRKLLETRRAPDDSGGDTH